jgi:hypothetical protein
MIHDHILAFEEYFGITSRGASGSVMYRGHSYCLCHVYIYTLLSVFLYVIFILLLLLILFTKVILHPRPVTRALCSNAYFIYSYLWLLPASYIFLLYNRKRTESGTPDVKRGSVCVLVSYQWCGGLYFAGNAISTGGCPPQTPRLDRHKSFWTLLRLYRGLISIWHLIVHFSKVGTFWWMFEGPWWRSNLRDISM